MIPIIYSANTTTFTTNGLGGLADCIDCTVNEERNGAYELSLTYPMTGINFENLAVDNLIKAKSNRIDGPQVFRIYYISKPMNGKVVVQAEHISYMTRHIPVRAYKASTASAAVSGIVDNSAIENPFTFYTNIKSTTDFENKMPRSCRELLGGSDGSLLDVYHGEYKYDNYNISYLSKRGTKSNLSFEYGKNIIDMTQEENISEMVTGVLPYYKKDAQNDSESDVYIEGDIVKVNINGEDISSKYSYPRIIPLDVSNNFDDTPTKSQIEQAAEEYITANELYKPKINITVDVVALGDAIGYENLKGIDDVGLCDTVTVRFADLGIDCSAKIVSYDYDVLKERYKELEIGDAKKCMTDNVTYSFQSVEEKRQETENFLVESLKRASAWIRGVKDSYLYINRGSDGEDSIMFLDNKDKSAATDILIINKNGIGFGHNGIDGDFDTAWTNKGEFIADYIKSGTIKSIEINNGNGTFKVDKNGNVIANSLTATGAILKNATITNGTIVVNTSSKTYDVISLNCGDWHCTIAPLGLTVSNNEINTSIVVQAGGVFFYKNNSDDATLFLSNDGDVNANGNIMGDDIFLKLNTSDSYKTSVRSLLNNILDRLNKNNL